MYKLWKKNLCQQKFSKVLSVHAIKAYGEWRNGSTKIKTRHHFYRRDVRFTARLLYEQVKCSLYPCKRRPAGYTYHIQCERCGEEKRLFPLPAIESGFTGLLAHSTVIISTALSKRIPVYPNICINYVNIIKSSVTKNGNFNRITEPVRCFPPPF